MQNILKGTLSRNYYSQNNQITFEKYNISKCWFHIVSPSQTSAHTKKQRDNNGYIYRHQKVTFDKCKISELYQFSIMLFSHLKFLHKEQCDSSNLDNKSALTSIRIGRSSSPILVFFSIDLFLIILDVSWRILDVSAISLTVTETTMM